MYRFSVALTFAMIGFTGTASAQQVIVMESGTPVYSGIPESCCVPMYSTGPIDTQFRSPFEVRFPRATKVLQVIADPTLVLNHQPNSPWNAPSNHPVIDAAPNIASLTFFAVAFKGSGALNAVSFFVPIAIRLARVLLYGPPMPGTRGETLLWIAAPTVARIRLANRENGGLFHPPLIQRPLLPWRRNAATGYCR